MMTLTLAACGGGNDSGPTTPQEDGPTVTAIGAPTGPVVTDIIGAAGGTLASGDGLLQVVVPAGALAADTEIGVQPVENLAVGGLGPSYDLTPDGQQFAQPVTLTFAYADSSLGGTGAGALAIAFQTPERTWRLAEDISIDTGAKTVSATTTHFTSFANVEKYRLDPPDAIVRIDTGRCFNVLDCYHVMGLDDQGNSIVAGTYWLPITSDVGSRILSHWAVNGVTGGDAVHGTVVPFPNHGDYLAPSSVPDPRDVALSVDLADPDDPGLHALLTATITLIVDGISGVIDFQGTRIENGVTTRYGGQAQVTYLTAEVSDGITRYDLPFDPAFVSIRFTQWDVDDGSRTCGLLGPATTLVVPPTAPATPAGSLFVYSSLSSYLFGALLSAEGTLRCVNPDDSVDTEPVECSVLLTTAATDGDPGFQAFGNGFPLVGSVNSTFQIDEAGGTVTQAMSWSLDQVEISK